MTSSPTYGSAIFISGQSPAYVLQRPLTKGRYKKDTRQKQWVYKASMDREKAALNFKNKTKAKAT